MITDNYVFFWGGVCSQWYPSKFTIDCVEYTSAEQYMMAKKALLFNDDISYDEIMETDKPMTQKAIGKRVKNFDKDKWEAFCRDYVFEGNYAKFTQNPKMLEELLTYGDRDIVEASPEDKIWGIGLHESDPKVHDPSKWEGTNWLGLAIMRVRDTLKVEAAFK